EVVAADALDAAVDRQVALLLKAGPVASAQAKSLVRDVAWLRDRDAIDVANADLIARLRVSAEGQEGLSSFLDKRAPAWTETK
ncbi:MAG TPA: enoyl-CoA hydratase/isomerase family protein, partial [Luteimonas sp.]